MESFLDKAKKVIEKNRDVLKIFEELDKTGKLRSLKDLHNNKKVE